MSRLSRSRISAECGAARMLRWPSARGPNSQAPSIQPTTRPATSSSAVRSISRASVELFDGLTVLCRRAQQVLRVHRRAPERMVRHVTVRLAEIDPIGIERSAECAARIAGRGGTNMRSNPDSARIRAFATPLSATPPPRHRSGKPVSWWSARSMSTSVSSSTRWTLAAQSANRRPSAVSRSIGS